MITDMQNSKMHAGAILFTQMDNLQNSLLHVGL